MSLIDAAFIIPGLVVGSVVAWSLTRAHFMARLAVAQNQAQTQSERADAITADYTQRLANQQEMHRQTLDTLKGDHSRLTDAFDALAARALERNSSAFLSRAEQRLKQAHELSAAELAKREQAVKSLVDPLTKSLAEVRQQMTSAERARAEAYGALTQQVKDMSTMSDALREETAQLTSALRQSHTRGQWGEIQLRRVVEVAGMLDRVDFSEQVSVKTDDGTHRPDMVVHLPGGKQVVVDAKVSLAAFLDASEADEDSDRENILKLHASHVRNHVKSLADKSYWESIDSSPEFVVMFLPADSMLSAALGPDPDLLEDAFASNVIIATPATLIALLRTVAYTWRQEQLTENAKKIFDHGYKLHQGLRIFGERLEDVGKRINSTVEAFNRLNRSIDATLVPRAKKFSELQHLETPLSPSPPLEASAVPANRPDLFTISAPDPPHPTG